MNFDLTSNIESCLSFINANGAIMSLVYYSHIPTAIISLLIGFFVFLKDRRSLISKILLSISLSFSIWSLLDLITWGFGYDSVLTMFSWSLLGIFNSLIFLCSLYFVYVFIDKRDISFPKKIALATLFSPVLLLTPTKFNLKFFDIANCEAVENKYFTDYYYYLSLLVFLWILVVLFVRYRKAEKEFKKQILLMGTGIELFLFSFFASGFLSSLLNNYIFLIYGMFGMVIFMGFLAYLIVKFKAFNIKLIGAQALVVTLVVIIGSQFAFIQNPINKTLTAITLTLAVGFGWILIRSVKREVKQREELEIANDEIEKSNREIETRNKKLKRANKEISERKEQLQKISDSLAIANDKLKKLDTAKTDFISMASHQLRTPPTPIKGYSSMLLEGSYGELNAEQKRAVENISAANNQQIAFVEDLLSVSRIESGSMKFVFEKCQIGDLCQEVINNLALKAKDKGLYLDYTAPATPLPELNIDGAKMREVISNLVDNAVKYTQKGGVTLIAEMCQKKDANCLTKPHLRVTVSDTGIGVPEEEIPYLFHKFSRGKDITRLNTGGTGLGLYVVKIITEANGGKVWIKSPGAGRGSKFIVELPLEQTQDTIERNG